MKRSEILRGIEAYANEQAQIGALILENGNRLSERAFDAAFGAFWPTPMRLEFFGGRTGDTFLLSMNGRHQQWLHLSKFMLAAGLIEAEIGDDGLVYYSLPC